MEQLGGKTENELWLERMNQMPKNELQLIGSGGFGRVYKFKEKSESETHVAVKIVSGLGSLNDYENQVFALQNEYRLVTELGNHPRIIQFFAIVRDEKNFQIMLIMEYLEGGSLADKLISTEASAGQFSAEVSRANSGGSEFHSPPKNIPQRHKACEYPLHCRGQSEDQRLRNSSRRPVADNGIGHVVAHSGRLSVFVSGATGGRRAERSE